MNCAQIQKDLQLYVDGRLDQSRGSMVQTHLYTCSRCRNDLRLYEIMRDALTDQHIEPEPENLTSLIMARIARAEEHQSAAPVPPFGWRWQDALLAAVLGTASTLLFLLVNPTLSTSFIMSASHAFPQLVMLIQAEGPASIPWIAWIIWVSIGIVLTLVLAGAEVRATWKRSLTQRLQTPLQLPPLW